MDPNALAALLGVAGTIAALALAFGLFAYGRSTLGPIVDELKRQLATEKLKNERLRHMLADRAASASTTLGLRERLAGAVARGDLERVRDLYPDDGEGSPSAGSGDVADEDGGDRDEQS